ncbi:DUF2388 domain-containing protein [Pseudomonas sp. PCH199]|uniref:DUF2388 domain-containing protein n=1 Tax=unclassified Pseudomonas TaxID=196821 RepID=UPI000BD5C09E|nr:MULTISPECIES: DUF2388 domain-containing protein [unclassified Pseudomonas]MCW8278231.1 DUF2388 domain-containing protein [Pseudomonas sp. PCH199]PAM81536.1 ribonucleotide reductase [Pseudomonas sp. ERMR1:02]
MNGFTKYRLKGSICAQFVKGYLSILTVALLFPFIAMANDETSFASYILTFAGDEVTTDISSPRRYSRFSTQAKEDAAAFVASDGAIRGPFLESAIQELRIRASPHLSDRGIASFILGGA